MSKRVDWSSWGWVLALVCLLAGAGCEWRRWEATPPRTVVPLTVQAQAGRGFTLTLHSAASIPMPPNVPAAHASALATLPNGELLACWWAGQHESAPDVRVYLARWRDGHWSEARMVVDRHLLGADLHMGVRRMGNPALWVAPDGRVHLFVVATGLGGWAASRVVQMISSDGGESFVAQRVLPLTPLVNTSVLVRTTPVALADGGWLLPAYFELGTKYPMVISFDRNGEMRWIQRIGKSVTSLQPALLPVSPTELHALMRDVGPQRRVQQAVSFDAGASWQDLPAADLSNRASSVAGLRLSGGGFVLLHNDSADDRDSPRQWLRLSTSDDAQHWSKGLDVQRGEQGDEFSYPSVAQIGSQLHVTYTRQRRAIAHDVYDIHYLGATP